LDIIAKYITDELEAPKAALDLVEAVDNGCQNLLEFPNAHHAFKAARKLKHEYRVLTVKNYMVFYVVDDESMRITIHRMVYKKRDLSQLDL
jgi:plasmid stabilization system protein ParE